MNKTKADPVAVCKELLGDLKYPRDVEALDAVLTELRELRAVAKNVRHCEKCGGSYYDDGLVNLECPCTHRAALKQNAVLTELRELRAEKDRLGVQLKAAKLTIDSMAVKLGIATDFLDEALQGEKE